MISWLQEQWLTLHSAWMSNGRTETTLIFVASVIAISVPYFATGFFFLYFDLHPEILAKYKSQPATNTPLDLKKLARVMKALCLNSTVGMFCMPAIIGLQVRFGVHASPQFPSLAEFISHIIFFILIEEVGFYYSHRLLHVPMFYKSVHKQHHEWIAPIGLTAAYSHPFEFIISALLPFVMGPCLLGSHILSAVPFYACATSMTVFDHCGYVFPVFRSNVHDVHHQKFNFNFGVIGLCDWLHGTEYKPVKQQ